MLRYNVNLTKCIKINNTINSHSSNYNIISNGSIYIYRSFVNNNNNNEIHYNDNSNNNKDTIKRMTSLKLPEIKRALSITEKKKLTELEKKLSKLEKSEAKQLQVKRDVVNKSINNKRLEIQDTISQFENVPPEFTLLYPKKIKDKFIKKLENLDESKIEQSELIKEFNTQKKSIHEKNNLLMEEQQNENTIKNNKHLSLLFGKSVVENQILKPGNPNVDTVIEFSYQDKFYIGIIKEVSPDNKTYRIERLITDNHEDGGNGIGETRSDIIFINKFDIVNFWKNSFGGTTMKIEELVKLELKYRENQFEFNNYISSKSASTLFINEFEFTSFEVSKLIYATSTPTKEQVYFTFKYLSSNSDIVKPKDGKLGFQFIQFDKQCSTFINKIKLLLDQRRNQVAINQEAINKQELNENDDTYNDGDDESMDIDFDKHYKELELEYKGDQTTTTTSLQNSEDDHSLFTQDDDTSEFYQDDNDDTTLESESTISIMKNSGTIIKSSNEIGMSSIFDDLKANDIYYLNLLKQASLSPFNSFPSDDIFRKILKELEFEVSPIGASNLLKEIGFLEKDESSNHNFGLWTNELLSYIDKVISTPNEIQDVLGDTRMDFKLPVIAIDPHSTFAVDDSFSIDFTSSDLVDKLYIHIVDLSRWMPDNKENILYKTALLNLKTAYLPQGVFHMFPPKLIQQISLNNSSTNNQSFTITTEMNFEKGTGKMISYKIYPTRLSNVVSISQDQATQIINNINKDEEINGFGNNSNGNANEISGKNILYQVYKFILLRRQHRVNNKRDLDNYGRQGVDRTTVKINENSNQSNVKLSKTTYSIGHEIIDEFLSSTDDVFTDFFQKNNAFGFYRFFGQADFQRISKASSFLTATSPLRNFTHLYTQLQLSSLLRSGSGSGNIDQPTAIFNWDYISSIGNDVVRTLTLKQMFQTKLTNYYLLKSIEKEIKTQKESNFKIKQFKPQLQGKVLSIDYKNYQFSIHLPRFKYSTTASILSTTNNNNNNKSSYQNRPQSIPFKVGDNVQVSVDDFDLKRSILLLSFLKKN